ncbi:MAG TPA: HAD family hydrolase [Patescibacteria group bacterium]|nr:HAD family hydrolase [Patescibacteria group bacterium]
MAQDRGVLIVFDLVSTLTDAGPRYVQAFLDVTEKAGFERPDPAAVMDMLGNKNLSEITDTFAAGLDPAGKKEFMQECNDACDILLRKPGWKERLFPNVREAIETMHLRGVTLGIYTGTREDAMTSQLAYHGIEDLFKADYMRGKDNLRDAGKANTALKAEQLQSIVCAFRAKHGDKAPVIVIGDSRADAEAAAAQGLYFIGFATDAHKRELLENAGVRAIVTDFGDVPDLIDRLTKPPANDLQRRPGKGLKFQP